MPKDTSSMGMSTLYVMATNIIMWERLKGGSKKEDKGIYREDWIGRRSFMASFLSKGSRKNNFTIYRAQVSVRFG